MENFKVGDTVKFADEMGNLGLDKKEWIIDSIYIESSCVNICDKDKQNICNIPLAGGFEGMIKIIK